MIQSTAILLVELVALFFGVAFFVQLMQRRLGPERLRSWMGGPPLVSALKGIAVGFVTPFCTYSAIPLLIGFRQAGVSAAGYVAFIVAAPVLDPILFGALILIAGLEAAVIYLVVAFTAALSLALVAEAVGIERHLKPLPAALVPAMPGRGTEIAVECEDPVCETVVTEPGWTGLRAESLAAAGAATALLRSLGPLLLLGVGIGLVIETLVSPDMVAGVAGDNNVLAIPTAAALGTPLYFNTELFVPIANSLGNAGVGIGAIVALTIAGAGANVPEFVILSRLTNRRLLIIFTGFVFAVAIAGGLLAHALVA